MAEIHNFKIGDEVSVINRTMSGTFIVEGKGKITRLLPSENSYGIRFTMLDGRPCGPKGYTYERYVDPAAQDDPEAHVAKLNER